MRNRLLVFGLLLAGFLVPTQQSEAFSLRHARAAYRHHLTVYRYTRLEIEYGTDTSGNAQAANNYAYYAQLYSYYALVYQDSAYQGYAAYYGYCAGYTVHTLTMTPAIIMRGAHTTTRTKRAAIPATARPEDREMPAATQEMTVMMAATPEMEVMTAAIPVIAGRMEEATAAMMEVTTEAMMEVTTGMMETDGSEQFQHRFALDDEEGSTGWIGDVCVGTVTQRVVHGREKIGHMDGIVGGQPALLVAFAVHPTTAHATAGQHR